MFRALELLRLMRVHNIFTAFADVWAGYFIVIPLSEVSWRQVVGLLIASGCVYSAGMVFNDVFDVERDRQLHPGRPLPSGRVSVRAAAMFAGLLQVIGVGAAAFGGAASPLVAAIIVALTFSYNGWLKKYRWVGSANMAACRFGNMALGMSAGMTTDWLWPLREATSHAEWVFPALLFLYVFVVTVVSTLEESPRVRVPLAGLLAALVGVMALLAWGLECNRDLGLKLLGVLALWILVTAVPAFRHPTPPNVGQIIRVSLTGIIIFDACMLLGVGQATAGQMLIVAIVPTYLIGRLLRPGTGS